MYICPQCQNEYHDHQGQVCSGCEQDFCSNCAVEFETCELCDRSFCPACASEFIQIPTTRAICNQCYPIYIEDTDFLFD